MKRMNVCPYCQRCRWIDDDSYACIECDDRLRPETSVFSGGTSSSCTEQAADFRFVPLTVKNEMKYCQEKATCGFAIYDNDGKNVGVLYQQVDDGIYKTGDWECKKIRHGTYDVEAVFYDEYRETFGNNRKISVTNVKQGELGVEAVPRGEVRLIDYNEIAELVKKAGEKTFLFFDLEANENQSRNFLSRARYYNVEVGLFWIIFWGGEVKIICKKGVFYQSGGMRKWQKADHNLEEAMSYDGDHEPEWKSVADQFGADGKEIVKKYRSDDFFRGYVIFNFKENRHYIYCDIKMFYPGEYWLNLLGQKFNLINPVIECFRWIREAVISEQEEQIVQWLTEKYAPKVDEKYLEKSLGCMLGGAAGDALGYAVEFFSHEEIVQKYGVGGIKSYELRHGKALISDDTQMSLFTAVGALRIFTLGFHPYYPNPDLTSMQDPLQDMLSEYIPYQRQYLMRESYYAWLKTQREEVPSINAFGYTYLNDIPELNHRRSPGRTCIAALKSGKLGLTNRPINDSKGCGGVMRVAPIGILYAKDKDMSLEQIAEEGAEAAALTHGHDLGYIPAAALVYIIAAVCRGKELKRAAEDAIFAMHRLYRYARHLEEFDRIMNLAIELSAKDMDDVTAIGLIGEGWVAEETLAIAVYCALKYKNDFKKAICAAVNHSGDSDSTGAITGNIVGAYLGVHGIPAEYLEKLELKEVISEIATDLADNRVSKSNALFYLNGKWMKKYG